MCINIILDTAKTKLNIIISHFNQYYYISESRGTYSLN